MDENKHAADLDKLERAFHTGNDVSSNPENIFLSLRPKSLYRSNARCSPWSNASRQEVMEDATGFKRRYEAHVQFIFSRVQHHWHPKNEKGERILLPYCRNKHAKGKNALCCKQNFPRHVAVKQRQQTRLVCRGIAAELRLKIAGRRNMLGSISA